MPKIYLSTIIALFVVYGCAQSPNGQTKIQFNTKIDFKLTDYLSENKFLDKEVERAFLMMDDTAIVAQLLMPAVGRLGLSKDTILSQINKRLIGGVLMLNGTKEEFTSWIKSFEKENKAIGNLPFLYSADAEPSLVNRKIIGSKPVKKANELLTIEEVFNVTDIVYK